MTITIEKTKTVTEQVEITLPHFRRSQSGVFYYKVYSKDNCIQVTNYNRPAISVNYFESAFTSCTDLENGIECSEAEFNEVFSKVMEQLSELTFNSQPC